MASYIKKKTRATKKKTARKTRKEDTAISRKRRKVAIPKKKRRAVRVVKKTRAKAKAKVRIKKKSRRAKALAAKPKIKRRKPVTPVKKRRKVISSAKKRIKTKKVLAKKKTRKKVAATKRLRVKKLAKKLAAVRKLEQKNRGAKRRSSRRTPVKAKKKAIEKSRREVTLREQLRAVEEPTARDRRDALMANWLRLRARRVELLNLARATGQLPTLQQPTEVFDKDRVFGHQRMVVIERWVDETNVQSILRKINRVGLAMQKQELLPNWTCQLVFSGVGESLFGSGQKLLDADDPDAENMQVEGYDNTGIWNTYDRMFEQLTKMITEYGEEERSMVYLHSVTPRNFKFGKRGVS